MQAMISLIDLVNALESVTHGLEWRVDLVTGDLALCEAGGERPQGDARFRMLPTNGALREIEIRRAFCATLDDAAVQETLAGVVGTSAFVDQVRRADVLDAWLLYRRSRLVNVALEWAAAEDVVCRRDLFPTGFATN